MDYCDLRPGGVIHATSCIDIFTSTKADKENIPSESDMATRKCVKSTENTRVFVRRHISAAQLTLTISHRIDLFFIVHSNIALTQLLRQPQRRSPQVATNQLRPRPYPDEAGDFSSFSSSCFPLSPSGIRVTHGTSRPPGRRAVGSLTAIPSFLPPVRPFLADRAFFSSSSIHAAPRDSCTLGSGTPWL